MLRLVQQSRGRGLLNKSCLTQQNRPVIYTTEWASPCFGTCLFIACIKHRTFWVSGGVTRDLFINDVAGETNQDADGSEKTSFTVLEKDIERKCI